MKETKTNKFLRNNKSTILAVTVFIFGLALVIGTTISDGESTFSGGITVTNIDSSDGKVEFLNNISLGINDAISLSANADLFDDNYSSLSFYSQNAEAKSYIGWYDNFTTPGSPQIMGWMGCHYNLSGSGNVHRHCSIETKDLDKENANSKFELSYGTNTENAFAAFNNIAELVLRGNSNLRFLGGHIATDSGFIDIYPNNQTTYGIRYRNNSNGIQLEGTSSDEIYYNSDLNILDNEIYLNGSNHAVLILERRAMTNDAELRYRTSGLTRWEVGLDDDSTQTYYIYNAIRGKKAIEIEDSAGVPVDMYNLSGAGNAYVCVDTNGRLYRNNASTCI